MRLDVGRHVLQDLGRDDPVELAVGERQRRASPSLTSASAPSGTSPAARMAANMSRHPRQLVGVLVEGDHVAPRRYISNACRPAPHPRSRARSPGSSPSRSKSTVSIGALIASS